MTKQTEEHLVEEDAQLFGSLNAELADVMTAHLTTYIRSSVGTSMPMANAARVEKLINKVLPVYYRGMDIAEVYARRHVFSISHYPPKRRALILQQFVSDDVVVEEEEDEDETDIEMSDALVEDDKITAAKQLLQKENESPHEALQRLQDELQQLRDRYQTIQMRRHQLQQTVTQTEWAALLAQKALDTNPSQISLPEVQAVVQAVPLLLRRQQEAAALMQEMQEREKRRTVDEIEDAEHVMVPSRKRQPLGLLEQFERDLQHIGGDVTKLDWLQQVLVPPSGL
ncbi:hypothetical protein FisN_14Lh232 [Fistulifera solaris]|uniref:Uncharacterized protein n=1 Tax=Fistulifera solaris TaxID=1519565 RepID=A0A1Z5J9S8_FISSO|nr:hypothetical protein FisN_14Lh232 [Fistulifera solaris]|eukprot:GAX10716.1 hypothetical protein FisN_14Lh232 [Fistulifera solaris]